MGTWVPLSYWKPGLFSLCDVFAGCEGHAWPAVSERSPWKWCLQAPAAQPRELPACEIVGSPPGTPPQASFSLPHGLRRAAPQLTQSSRSSWE